MSEVPVSGPSEVIPAPVIEFDKLTQNITLYSGVIPFTYTIETLLEQLDEGAGVTKWFLTLHLTGFGTGQQIFVSNTVPVTLGTTATVAFPAPVAAPPGGSQYGLQAVSNGSGGSFTMSVVVNAPVISGGSPIVQIVNTTVNASWFVGVREIVITDPPIIMRRKD